MSQVPSIERVLFRKGKTIKRYWSKNNKKYENPSQWSSADNIFEVWVYTDNSLEVNIINQADCSEGWTSHCPGITRWQIHSAVEYDQDVLDMSDREHPVWKLPNIEGELESIRFNRLPESQVLEVASRLALHMSLTLARQRKNSESDSGFATAALLAAMMGGSSSTNRSTNSTNPSSNNTTEGES